MICETCHGTGLKSLVLALIPCPDCGGAGFTHCCEGDQAQPGDVAPVVEQIKQLLAGLRPELQGAILADCLAIWLAGHHVAGDVDATRKLRAELLADHCFAVRQLTIINAKMLGTTP